MCCEDNGLLQGLPIPGYFMLEDDPSSLVECTPPEACLGGSFGEASCKGGYVGKRCAACQSTEPKYYRSDGLCEKCDSIIPLPALIVLAVIVLVGVAMLADTFLSKAQNAAELLAPALILTTFFQTLSLLVKVEIQWPSRLRALMTALSILNFNIELASPECSTKFDANARLNLVLASPFAVMLLVLLYAGTRFFAHKEKITVAELANKVRLLLIGALILGSTFFVKGVLGGLDCTLQSDGRYYLDIEAEIECDQDKDDRYKPVLIKGVVGLAVWSLTMAVARSFLSDTGKARYAFLTAKMEDKYYWWELLLLLRKLLITASGLLNTSTPSRGWYLSSLVIILSLAAHAYARPFKDPWEMRRKHSRFGLHCSSFRVGWSGQWIRTASWRG
jgi:hypothetical protein